MKPAMTAEQWNAYLYAMPYDDGEVEMYGPPHEVAARCLYGQTFGFTREDVHGLRLIANGNEFFLSLAYRIEALLPPEEKE